MRTLHDFILIGLIAETCVSQLSATQPKAVLKRERKFQFADLSAFIRRIANQYTTKAQYTHMQGLAKEGVNMIVRELKADYAEYAAQPDCPEHLKNLPEHEITGVALTQTMTTCMYQLEYMLLMVPDNMPDFKRAIGLKGHKDLAFLVRLLLDNLLPLFSEEEFNTLNDSSSRLAELAVDLLESEHANLYQA